MPYNDSSLLRNDVLQKPTHIPKHSPRSCMAQSLVLLTLQILLSNRIFHPLPRIPKHPHRNQHIPRPMTHEYSHPDLSLLSLTLNTLLCNPPFPQLLPTLPRPPSPRQIPAQSNHTPNLPLPPPRQPKQHTDRTSLTKTSHYDPPQLHTSLQLPLNQTLDILHTFPDLILTFRGLIELVIFRRLFRRGRRGTNGNGREGCGRVPGGAVGFVVVRRIGEDPFQMRELVGGLKLVGNI